MMTKSRKVADYIDKELPYQLLMHLNDDSRMSLRQLGKELGISYHVVASKLRELESRYKLAYTLELDTDKLGFTEGKLITIKFETQPSIDILKEEIANNIYVQDAYMAQGDFDLLLYVVGLTQRDFQNWQFKLRVDLSAYKPKLKVSSLNSLSMGFFPIKSELILKSTVLSNTEKKILTLLNDNSRMKLGELVSAAHTTQMKAIYVIKKLKQMGIIKRFAALVQNPEKRILTAFGAYIYPGANHKSLTIDFERALVSEDLHEGANDYSIIANTNGAYDAFFACTFSDGEAFSKKGPNLIKTLWSDEKPQIESAMLIDMLSGKWPFALNRYKKYEEDLKKIKLE